MYFRLDSRKCTVAYESSPNTRARSSWTPCELQDNGRLVALVARDTAKRGCATTWIISHHHKSRWTSSTVTIQALNLRHYYRRTRHAVRLLTRTHGAVTFLSPGRVIMIVARPRPASVLEYVLVHIQKYFLRYLHYLNYLVPDFSRNLWKVIFDFLVHITRTRPSWPPWPLRPPRPKELGALSAQAGVAGHQGLVLGLPSGHIF
jgi:hypothetical protein